MGNRQQSPSLKGDSLRLRILPLAIALIVATTMIPIQLRHPSLSYFDTQIQLFDILENIVLYLPFGFALNRSPLKALGAGFLLSSMAEILQFAYVNRDPSLMDVASNTAGAFLGALAAYMWKRLFSAPLRAVPIARPTAICAILMAIAGFIALLGHHPPADFSNWDRNFQLAAGDELIGGRPWHGSISALFIYAEAFTPAQLLALNAHGPQALSVSENHSFPPPLYEASGTRNPLRVLDAVRGRPLLTPQEQQAFFAPLYARNQLTILVWLRPGDLKQTGPARIVTYSADFFERNFTLAQSFGSLVFRLRTPVTGPNGADPELTTLPLLSPHRQSFVAAVFDGADSRLFVDGRLAGGLHLTSHQPRLARKAARFFSRLLSARELELTLGELFIGGFLTLGLLALYYPPRPNVGWWIIAIFTGFGSGIALSLATGSSIGYAIRIVLLCFAAALTAALAIEFPSAGTNLRQKEMQ